MSVYRCEQCDEYRDGDWVLLEEASDGELMCENCIGDYRPDCKPCQGTGIGWLGRGKCLVCKGRGHLHSRNEIEAAERYCAGAA